MSTSHPSLPSLGEEELVAYLDGELGSSEVRALEERLARDPAARTRLQELQRTWDLLDELDQTPPDDRFTQTTLEMVAVAAAAEVPARRRLRRAAMGVAALLVAAAAGYAAVAVFWPSANRRLLDDLPLLENWDDYRQVEDIDFLRQLAAAGLFTPGQHSGSAPHGDESPAERKTRIEQMTDSQLQELARRQQQLGRLDEKSRQRLWRLHEQLDADPNGSQLRSVMNEYRQWLEGLPPYQRAELLQLPSQERIERIRTLRPSPADVSTLLSWIEQYARKQESRVLEQLPENQREQLARLPATVRERYVFAWLWNRWNTLAPGRPSGLTTSDLEELHAALRPAARARLQGKPPREQWKLMTGWIRQVWAEQGGVAGHPKIPVATINDEELSRFFESELANVQRDHLLALPADQFDQELRRMYLAAKRPAEPGLPRLDFPRFKKSGELPLRSKKGGFRDGGKGAAPRKSVTPWRTTDDQSP